MAMIIDPMLATGGSALAALASLNAWGVPRVKLLSVIGSREGIDNVLKADPKVEIHICAIDAELNAQKYIVPGLGDAGDRIFATRDRE
jgi:uracil phosphoribosyltransferase